MCQWKNCPSHRENVFGDGLPAVVRSRVRSLQYRRLVPTRHQPRTRISYQPCHIQTNPRISSSTQACNIVSLNPFSRPDLSLIPLLVGPARLELDSDYCSARARRGTLATATNLESRLTILMRLPDVWKRWSSLSWWELSKVTQTLSLSVSLSLFFALGARRADTPCCVRVVPYPAARLGGLLT